MKAKLLSLLAIAFLSGCATSNSWKIYNYSSVTKSKSIIVPAGNEGLKGYIKQALVDDGWKLIVKNTAPYRTKGLNDKKVNLRQYQEVNANYAMTLSFWDLDTRFALSIYDVDSGEEILSMSKDGFPAYTWISTHKTWTAVANQLIKSLN